VPSSPDAFPIAGDLPLCLIVVVTGVRQRGPGDIAPVDNEGETTMSVVYPTETMANRPFAAEIRHDPVAVTALLEEALDVSDAGLGEFVSVRCEGTGEIDRLLTFTDGDRSTIVGIESKFDHELTNDQVDKEHGGGHLVVVLPEVTDAPECPDLQVREWADALGLDESSVRSTNTVTTEDGGQSYALAPIRIPEGVVP